VIQFAPTAKTAAASKGDELDSAGRSILSLLHKAAGVAEANSQHALDLAQKLSQELRTAEDRIAQLETDVRYYQERTDRAEQWLHKIFTEIEERFLRPQQQDQRGRPAYGRGAR
jgi:predicted  nucleic acid-binding Zn-ribbon protein